MCAKTGGHCGHWGPCRQAADSAQPSRECLVLLETQGWEGGAEQQRGKASDKFGGKARRSLCRLWGPSDKTHDLSFRVTLDSPMPKGAWAGHSNISKCPYWDGISCKRPSKAQRDLCSETLIHWKHGFLKGGSLAFLTTPNWNGQTG